MPGLVFPVSTSVNMHPDHSSRRVLHTVQILGSLAVVAVCALALADDRASASLELRGSVPVNCTVDVAPTSKASSLDLRAGEQDVLVGVVTENCNSRHGYTVTVNSDGRGQLHSSANGSVTAPFSVRYDGAAGATAEQIVASRDQPSFGRQGNLTVTIPPNTAALAGDYSANLSLVITAK